MAKPTDRRDVKSGSVAAGLAAFANVGMGDIAPPKTVKLRPGDRKIWRQIMVVRARDEWSEIDLHHAANLTRCLADIERISGELAREGDTVENARGTLCVNPKHALLETLSRRAVALTRLLHLHAAVLVGEPRDLGAARDAEKAARAAAAKQGEDDDDDLLARPTVQ